MMVYNGPLVFFFLQCVHYWDSAYNMFSVGWGEVQLWAGEDEETILETDVHKLHWKVNRGEISKILAGEILDIPDVAWHD